MPSADPPAYVAIVTGANSGIGYGICQRLLSQTSQRRPPDSCIILNQHHSSAEPRISSSGPLRSLHLIMACRNLEKAEAAKSKLLQWFEKTLKASSPKTGLKSEQLEFFEKLRVHVLPLDLASVQSTFAFCKQVIDIYPYVTHLFCNAGILDVVGINGRVAAHQMLTELVVALSVPRFNIERVGDLTQDGLGRSWQSNCFGHYIIVRQLDSLLKKSPLHPARVIWLSSRGAAPNLYDTDDWQLTRTTLPYFSSKRQVDMLSWHLNSQFHSDDTLPPIRHFTVEPGIASTNIVPSNIAAEIFKQVFFFICRMTGSPFFTITAYNAATAIICAALAPLDIFPDMTEPLKLSSTVNRWGRAGAMLLEITGLQETQAEDIALLGKYERLYQVFAKMQDPLLVG
ncbi:hypothetical protein JB92DRAFT_2818585 [Gautieria morchelliformis]|nr:hypothetical protein JB92DRAFT_2818585 [Gautieria morchelliformis]